MGIVLAAAIVLLVLGASMGLLFAHLEQVDEYNRQVSKVSEMRQDAVQEDIAVSVSSTGDGTYDISIRNTGSRPAEIIGVRLVHPDGTVDPIREGTIMRLAGSEEGTLSYDVPDNIDGNVLIRAITSMGNTFSAEIKASGATPEGDADIAGATINGMGLASRLVQAEYSGHTIFGSSLWGEVASLKPYTMISVEDTRDPPRFAAALLDSDESMTWQITDYTHNELVTLNSDGTLGRDVKANLLEYVSVRGDASVSSSPDGITISADPEARGAILKLDPELFGKTLLLDADVGNGRVEILTSPYGSLADSMTPRQIIEQCKSPVWSNYPPIHWRADGLVPKMIYTVDWIFDPSGIDVFLVHKQIVPTAEPHRATTTYDKSNVTEERHIHTKYWGHRHDGLRPSHASGTPDHSYYLDSNLYGTRHRYFDHPGSYTITYDQTVVNLGDMGILLRDSGRFYVSYGPELFSRIFATESGDERAHTGHPNIRSYLREFAKVPFYRYSDGALYTAFPHRAPSHTTAYADSEPHFRSSYEPNPYTPRPDTTFGIPQMLYTSGNNGNTDYAHLASITLNGFRTTTDNTLCVFAETPYKIRETISSDMQHHKITLPDRDDTYAQHLYIRVVLGDSPITLKAVGFESLASIGAEIPYRIFSGPKTLRAGLLATESPIDFTEEFPDSFSISLYPESMLYRGSFSTIVFDPHSRESFRIPATGERIYTVHTWVQIPVVGTVTVSDLKVLTREGSELRLGYLDGSYTASQDDSGRIWVPVIPGYYSIHMKINGVDAVLRYSDVLGSSNVKIITPSTNTVSKESTMPITMIEASAGAVAYAIATHDGNMAAIVQGTVSGNAYIEHKYDNPRKMFTCFRDPLSGWIQVYKNGDLFRSGYRFVNYEPEISTRDYVDSDGYRHVRTTFEYDEQYIRESVSIPVRTGDFVEFYIRSHIHSESELPLTSVIGQCWTTVFPHYSSQASATANIHDGSIIIG